MQISPMLVIHICGGTVGLLSGAAAISFRKGSRRHLAAGNVFLVSMLTLAASGVYMAVMKSQPGNIMGGTLTFYLVATGWMTARRREGETSIFDWGALLFALAIVTFAASFALEAIHSPTGRSHGYPPGLYAFLGSIALVGVAGDVRMIVRGGISGTQRLARHLWRMCFALFIALISIFASRPQLFPAFFRKTGLLFFLSVLPLMLMIFWLVRVLLTKAYEKQPVASSRDVYSTISRPEQTADSGYLEEGEGTGRVRNIVPQVAVSKQRE